MAQEMKDSGIPWIGEIPADWELKNIKALFSFGKGLPITKDNLCDSGVTCNKLWSNTFKEKFMELTL